LINLEVKVTENGVNYFKINLLSIHFAKFEEILGGGGGFPDT